MTESDERSTVIVPGDRGSGRAVAAYAWLREQPRFGAIETAAFWLGIGLPVVYLPLLATGIDGSAGSFRFASLLALHALCLLVGHSHRT